jgi:predicted deacylase
MKLYLGVWQGNKEHRDGYWLRWWDELGNILPWAVELVAQERLRAEQANERAEKLANYLRSQGINPEELSQSEIYNNYRSNEPQENF